MGWDDEKHGDMSSFEVEQGGVERLDYEDNGVPMGSGSYTKKSGRCGKATCWLLTLALLGACVALAYFVIPQFGLPEWLQGPATVAEGSVITHDAYDVLLQIPVETVEGDVIVYQHKQTKTPVMTILPYDTSQDNAFSISFRTKPQNSHGAPHVLEHSVLSGSKKYPVKDPFTELAKGSLQTFVNAMTMPDCTAYVFASRNDADMKNLMDVYLDAVFQPLVIEPEGDWIFRQEAWRVEMNETGEPTFNGVVLSEMKGGMSSPDAIMDQLQSERMFPNSTYRFNSGGDPIEIPNLTQPELNEFYKTFYHPSNAQVYVFGSKTTATNALNSLDDYLSHYEPRLDIREQSSIELQPILKMDGKKQKFPYATLDDSDNTHMLNMAWMISHSDDMGEDFQKANRLKYGVLELLLFQPPSGVMYKTLRDSGLASRNEGSIDMSSLQWVLTVNSANIKANETDAVESLVKSTLKKIVDVGFPDEDIDSALDFLEYIGKDQSTGTFPRGIAFWFEIMETWKFDVGPATGFLSFNEDIKHLRKEVKRHGSSLFTRIIQERILDNPHNVVIELYPDLELEAKQKEEEQERMIKLRHSQGFEALLEETDALTEVQAKDDSPEDLAKIPQIKVEDLAPRGYEAPIFIDENRDGSGVTVLVHETVSSFGIGYVDYGIDISMLAIDDVVILPLLTKLMIEAGTEAYDQTTIARQIQSYTGGIFPEILLDTILPRNSTKVPIVPDGNHLNTKLFMHGSALKEKSSKLFELLSEIMFRPLLDDKDLAIAWLKEQVAFREDSLSMAGHTYAMKRLQARYTVHEYVMETFQGLSTIPILRDLLETAQNDWPALLKRLKSMHQELAKGPRNGMILNLSGEQKVLQHTAKNVAYFLGNQLPRHSETEPLPDFSVVDHPWVTEARAKMAKETPVRDEGIVIPGTVNYVVKGGPFYLPGEPVPGSMNVVTQFLEYNNFFVQIREKRGAYGAFALFEYMTGILMFASYRDPNLSETLEVYDDVAQYLRDQMKNPATAIPLINSAIIGTIGALDGSAPQANGAGWISMLQWLKGSNAKLRQKWREGILATNNNDFLEYAKRISSWKASLAVSAPKAVLEKEQQQLNLTLIDAMETTTDARDAPGGRGREL